MTEQNIRITVDGDEARRRLSELEDQIEEVEKDADSLEESTRTRGRGSGGGSRLSNRVAQDDGGFGRAARTAAAALIAFEVAQTVTSAVGQQLEQSGFAEIGTWVQQLQEAVTGVTALGAKISGALGAIQNVTLPFALSGVGIPGEALTGAAQIGAARATREAQLERRRLGRGIVAIGNTVGRLLRSGF